MNCDTTCLSNVIAYYNPMRCSVASSNKKCISNAGHITSYCYDFIIIIKSAVGRPLLIVRDRPPVASAEAVASTVNQIVAHLLMR